MKMDQVYDDGIFSNTVCKIVYEKFKKLPKKGKPQLKKEWTLLSAVVASFTFDSYFRDLYLKLFSDKREHDVRVISLGTGSKCIGKSKMSDKGDVLNDSHAEVVARRAFLVFLYNEVIKAYTRNDSEYFLSSATENGNKCSLKPGISFHLFISHTPCGDASIFPKPAPPSCELERKIKTSEGSENVTETSVESAIHLTGNLGQFKSDLSQNECISGISQDQRIPNTKQLHCDANTSKARTNTSPANLEGESDVNAGFCKSDLNQGFCKAGVNNPQSQSDFNQQEKRSVSHLSKDDIESLQGNTFALNGIIRKRKLHEDVIDYGDQIGEICEKSYKFSEDSNVKGNLSSSSSQIENDIYRTGAKCVPGGEQDPLARASGYHTTGALRTKPGRGERTESMSCSEKIARWNVLGCQGALLSLFMTHPIYFDSIIIGKCPYSHEALKRAIISRVSSVSTLLHPPYHVHQPRLLHTSACDFEFSRRVVGEQAKACGESDQKGTTGRIVPCSAAIGWQISDDMGTSDVTVHGRSQGVTKSDLGKSRARSKICSLSLFQHFHRLVGSIAGNQMPMPLRHLHLASLSYGQTKALAVDYQTAWSTLHQNVFSSWIRKSRTLLSFKENQDSKSVTQDIT